MEPDEQNLKLIEKIYTDFLDDEQGDGIYYDKINSLIKSQNVRLIVNINDLRNFNNERAYNLINKASGELLAFQRAVKNLILIISPTYGKSHEEFYIGLEGSFGSHHLTPRTLSSKYLGQIICMEGIVTKCSLIRPKVIRSVHYCVQTGKSLEKKYFDLTSLEPQPSGSIYPTKDEDGNLLVTEFGLSTYKDHQIITLQEVPEKAPPGQLPRSVDVICDDDLIDICKPGDRVQIVGFYRSLPGKKEGFTTATFRTVLIANNVLELTKDISPNISSHDIAQIKRLKDNNPADVFEILAQSLAPTIHGHEFVKRAVLCMLLGGVEKNLPNGTRLRGDINVLLIGDPSVAKSQILRYVLKTAPRAVATTGRGSSGVGLTAAVVTDMDTGVSGVCERRLEAGAMVLADRGIVCIDEFDKMSDADRTAIHEVMEQGRVTVAKAGIHARLNARCSVLAAANPVYGRYDQYKTPMENIGMQDSLLSRFDLLFIILDQSDTEQDRIISNHIVKVHQYRTPGEKEGEVFSNNLAETDFYNTNDLYVHTEKDDIIGSNKDDAQNEGDTIYEKYDHLRSADTIEKFPIVSSQFMKKYLYLARKVTPQLSEKSTCYISQEYVKLRAQSSIMVDNMARTQPITPRTLETIIRLSTAHAKARLSKTVDLEDAEAAVNMVQYAYFKKVISKPKNLKNLTQTSEDNIELAEDKNGEQSMDNESATEDSYPLTVPAGHILINDERFKKFKRRLLRIFDDSHTESIDINIVKDHINDGLDHDLKEFDSYYVDEALKVMANANQIMIDSGTIFKI